jgi:hypothetical protein
MKILNCIGDANFTQEIANSIREVKGKRIDGDEIKLEDIRVKLERLISITESSAPETNLNNRE